MSDLPSNIRRQKRIGYFMLAWAAVLLLGSAAAVQFTSVPSTMALGMLVPVAILGFFGYRSVAAGRDRRALGDERTEQLYGKVGLNAFWILMSVMVVDMAIEIVPREGVSLVYVSVGLVAYGAYFGYYRYVA